MLINDLKKKIFKISNFTEFEEMALNIFQIQYREVEIYRRYCDILEINPEEIDSLENIPFLPISFFKSQSVLRKGLEPQLIFKSSGTTQNQIRSIHRIADESLYIQSLIHSFNHFLGKEEDYHMISLLPNYEENPESSLIFMTKEISKKSLYGKMSSFTTKNDLKDFLVKHQNGNEKLLLFGVSFALLELAESFNLNLSSTVILETGGMKGRRKEITRSELHSILKEKLQPASIISEYGMTELLSQAYTSGGEDFNCPPWMKVLVRDVHDPFNLRFTGSGGLNVIDLANVDSCSFIETEDLTNINDDGSFKVLGRFDHSDIRGCNLLYN